MTIETMRESYPALLKKAGYRTGFVGKIGVALESGAAEEMFDFHRFAIASNKGNPYLSACSRRNDQAYDTDQRRPRCRVPQEF